MPQVIITDLPLDADGHQFWVSSVDYFGNVNIFGMPTINMAFPTLVAPSISNVTNIYSTYTEVDILETTEAQEIYPIFDRVNDIQITPIVVTGITTTARYFSYFEIQIDTSAAFNVSPSILVPASTFNDPTHTSRPITFSCIDGTEYHFRVRIFDVLGNVSPWSSSTTETAGDTVAPNEVGSSNVDFTTDGHFCSAVVDLGTYTQASDHAYYEWWVNTTTTHPGGGGLKEDDDTFYFANKSGQTLYLFVAAVDRSGNRSANYTTNVGNVPFVSADFWTETGDVTDLSGDPIIDVTDRGIEDENGVTIMDFSTGSGVTNYNAELTGAINFGTGGALHLTDNALSFAGTPIVGMEIIGRGLKLYEDANNYIVMEKDGASSVNFEVVGGTIKTSGGTSYVQMDSTGVKGYNASTQRFQLSSDGSGWLGGATDFYWDTSGNVTIAGTVTVTNIAATTGTIAGWDITSLEINITPVSNVTARLNSSGYIAFGDPAPTAYGNNAGVWLGMDSGTAKMSIYTDSNNFLQWDGSTLTMTGADFDSGTITASVFQTAASGSRVVINTADGIRAFNSTPTQTVSIDTDGSGWFGLTGTRAVEWTTAGVVTVAGWTATDTEFSGSGIITGGTLRTGTGNARVEMTSADGLRAFNSSGIQTADIDTDGSGWFGLTGTRSLEWTTAGVVDIAGWNATADLFRSATSAERIQLDASKNRISIFAATGDDKVVMGYLEGLGRNKAWGTATGGSTTYIDDSGQDWEIDQLIGLDIAITSGTGSPQTRTITDNTATRIYASFSPTVGSGSVYAVRYTSNNYGFWALDGDELMIDGDVTYESGDWIVHNDASLKILNGSGNEIIRLGTDTGEKGLFIYNTSSVQLAKYISDEIYIGDATDYLKYTVAGGLEVVGDVTISSYPAQPFDEDALLLWPLDSFPVDQSGNDNDANSTYGANVTYTDNGVAGGYCTHFPNGTGTGDYLRATTIYNLQEMTFTFWAKTSDVGNNYIFAHGSSTGFFSFNASTNRPRIYLSSGNLRYWNDESEQDDGEWHFWCLELAGSAQSDINNAKLFVDTTECTVNATTATSAPTAFSNLWFGYGFNGDLQDFRIYNRVLTSSERTALYTNPGNKGITRISGDKITTGTIESTNWGSTVGSQFDLNDGTFYLGGSSSPKLSWNGSTLAIEGAITLTNTIDASDISDVDPYATGDDEQTLNELLNDTPSGAGFYMDATHLGYHDGGDWDVFLGVSGGNGLFYLGGTSGDLQWDGTDLVLGGSAKLAFGTAFSPGGNLLVGAEDWKETQTPVTYFTSGYFNACYGDDDNNHIINSYDPYNNKSLIWECDPDDGTGSHGGWTGYDFDISRNQRFRFMNWVKRVGTSDGNLYFGCQPGTQDTSDLTADGSDSNDSNPYFGFPDLCTIGSERIVNGNCEGTGNWTAVGSPTTNARSATQHHGGSYSWRITVDAELEGTRSDAFTTTAQMEMCVSFWVYGDGEDWMVYVRDEAQRWYAHESNTTTTITPSTGSWSQYKIYFATSGNKTNVCLYFLSVPGTEAGTLYFDDVVCNENLISNGDQEIVSDFWVIHNTPTSHGLSTTQERNGTYSRRIIVDATNEGTKYTDISLKAGRQYRITTWLYGDGSSTWKIYINEAVNHHAVNSTGGTTLTPSAAWNRYDIDFVATEDTDSAILYILSVGTSGTLYIDDVTMQETPWLLYVGFIHPEAYKGTASLGGIYHYKTGQKIYSLTDYKHMSTADDQELRVFFYQCTTDYETNRLYMFSPKIHIVDGSEPSISDVIGNAQFISSDIQNSTNISSYLVSSPTIRGGDFAGGTYVQLDSTGLKSYNLGEQISEINSDGSGWFGKENWRRIEWNENGYSSARLMDYYLDTDWRFYLVSSSGHATMYFENGGGSNQEVFKIIHNNTIDRLQLECTSSGTGTPANMIESNTDFGVQVTTGDVKIQIGTETSGSYDSMLDLLQDVGYGTTKGFGDSGVTGWRINYDNSSTDRFQIISGNGTTTDTRFSIERDTGIISIPSGSNSTQMWTDASGYFNIKPDGDRLRIWDSAAESGDYGDIYSDGSGNLILQAGNGNVYVDDNFNVSGTYSRAGTVIVDASRNCDFNNVNADGAFQMDGSNIINTSGYQTGVLKTRQTLLFGYNTAITADDETITIDACTVNGSANSYGYRMIRGGTISGISLQFNCTDGSIGALFKATVQDGGVNTSMVAQYPSGGVGNIPINNNLGYQSTANSFTVSAGDTINIELSLYEEEMQTVTVDDIAIIVEFLT